MVHKYINTKADTSNLALPQAGSNIPNIYVIGEDDDPPTPRASLAASGGWEGPPLKLGGGGGVE
jgi:hypothetical protein